MVKTKTELEFIAKEYVKKLAENGIRIQQVIVFGSYGRGTATERSDIDLVYISKDFDRFNLLERQKVLSRCRPGLVRTDVLAYSPSMIEKRRMESPFIQQFLNEGQTLFSEAA